jgi:hypothetical protein
MSHQGGNVMAAYLHMSGMEHISFFHGLSDMEYPSLLDCQTHPSGRCLWEVQLILEAVTCQRAAPMCYQASTSPPVTVAGRYKTAQTTMSCRRSAGRELTAMPWSAIGNGSKRRRASLLGWRLGAGPCRWAGSTMGRTNRSSCSRHDCFRSRAISGCCRP